MAAAILSCSSFAPPAARFIISSSLDKSLKQNLPIRKIPGDCRNPHKDRLDYFYFQGREAYFRSRTILHGSTVLRLNVPPGPPIAAEPAVVALLDGAAFPVLFDTSKVEKKNVFVGTYVPAVELTGGYRVLPYLDPSEPRHGLLKSFIFYLLGSARGAVLKEFYASFGSAFDGLEAEVAEKGKADFCRASDQASLRFLCRAFFGRDPADGLGTDGPDLIGKWVLFQLAPQLTLGLPYLVDDAMLHNITFPPALIRAEYRRLYDFFSSAAKPALIEAERMGISKEEACHNVIFAICFNAFGGFKILFPVLMKWVAQAGIGVHTRLAEEVRGVVRAHGGEVTMRGIEEMTLVKSAVYEALRIQPPVPFQYGKAKKDLVIESHDFAYEVRSGEMLFGYQPFATRDPRIFDRAEEFIVDRFVGDDEKLLSCVVWSNGPETEDARVDNKQCAGKNLVALAARLLLAEVFLRYDSFEVETKPSSLGDTIFLTSLKKATF